MHLKLSPTSLRVLARGGISEIKGAKVSWKGGAEQEQNEDRLGIDWGQIGNRLKA